jgi:hypothetical protein
MKWYSTEEKFPDVGDLIRVRTIGCKLPDFTYVFMKVREGEGFGHFDKWRYATNREKEYIYENNL